MKTFRDPKGIHIKTADEGDSIKIAALRKLGWTEISAADIDGEDTLHVVYETVETPQTSRPAPVLPRLVKPLADAPTRDVPNTRAAGTTVSASGVVTEPDAGDKATKEVVTSDGGVDDGTRSGGSTATPDGITREDAEPLMGNKGRK